MTNATAVAVRPGPLARFHASMDLSATDLHRLRRIAVVGIVALNITDLLITRHLLGMGAVEANPFMALFIAGGWGIVIKLFVPVAIGVRHLRAPLRRGLVLGLCWMCVIYSGVVLWNGHVLETALHMR
jgi:hypothetical protein